MKSYLSVRRSLVLLLFAIAFGSYQSTPSANAAVGVSTDSAYNLVSTRSEFLNTRDGHPATFLCFSPKSDILAYAEGNALIGTKAVGLRKTQPMAETNWVTIPNSDEITIVTGAFDEKGTKLIAIGQRTNGFTGTSTLTATLIDVAALTSKAIPLREATFPSDYSRVHFASWKNGVIRVLLDNWIVAEINEDTLTFALHPDPKRTASFGDWYSTAHTKYFVHEPKRELFGFAYEDDAFLIRRLSPYGIFDGGSILVARCKKTGCDYFLSTANDWLMPSGNPYIAVQDGILHWYAIESCSGGPYFITTDSSTSPIETIRTSVRKMKAAGKPAWVAVFQPKINPLNGRVLGPDIDRRAFKGWLICTEVEGQLRCELSYQENEISSGAIAVGFSEQLDLVNPTWALIR